MGFNKRDIPMSSNTKPKSPAVKPMTPDAQRRIHSAEAKKGDGGVQKDSFPARAQRTVDTNSQEKSK